MFGRLQRLWTVVGALVALVGCGSGGGTPGVVAVPAPGGSVSPPAITAPPQPQAIVSGQAASFSVAVSGTPPFAYQWQRDGAAIPGATADTYSTGTLTVADNGAQFRVVVTNSAGSVTSAPVTVTVAAPAPTPPTIGTQPQPQTVVDGSSASFSVVASGSGALSYQWRRNGATISGATAATYATPALTLVDSGAAFSVVVTDANGSTTSSAATVTVQALAPSITSAPEAQSVAAGQNATFTVGAAGSGPLQYQWHRDGTPVPGANAPTFTLAGVTVADSGASFSVTVSNAAGSVTSAAAGLTVSPAGAPVLITVVQPAVAAERQAFSIVASVSGTPPFTYQWLRNGVPIPGASGSTNGNQINYTTPALLAADDGVRFRLEVSNSDGTVRGNELLFSVIGPAQVSGGAAHSLARSNGGAVYAWGENSAGQLGTGDNSARLTATQVTGLTDVIAVAAGRAHSLALRSDGSVLAWGANGKGQLGVGTQVPAATPQPIAALANVVAIAAAGDQSFAVRSDGTLWAWGDNGIGQLGDGSTTDRALPVVVQGLVNAGAFIVAVAAGPTHTLAVDQLGNVFAWGDNAYGQHGDTSVSARNAPVQVPGVSGAAGIAAGAGFSLALDLDARLWSWGRNHVGQLGDGALIDRAAPQQLTTLAGGGTLGPVLRIVAGADHAIALPFVGAPLAWGSNAAGQLGDGTVGGTRSRPAAVSGTPSGVRAVGSGAAHALLRAITGSVYGWGANGAGQIGNGASGSAPVTPPVPATGLNLN